MKFLRRCAAACVAVSVMGCLTGVPQRARAGPSEFGFTGRPVIGLWPAICLDWESLSL